MENCVEKIYCYDRDNNDNALAAAILANGGYRRDNDSPWAMAAMMNNGGWNQNQWMNNPFAYLMFLALFPLYVICHKCNYFVVAKQANSRKYVSVSKN